MHSQVDDKSTFVQYYTDFFSKVATNNQIKKNPDDHYGLNVQCRSVHGAFFFSTSLCQRICMVLGFILACNQGHHSANENTVWQGRTRIHDNVICAFQIRSLTILKSLLSLHFTTIKANLLYGNTGRDKTSKATKILQILSFSLIHTTH